MVAEICVRRRFMRDVDVFFFGCGAISSVPFFQTLLQFCEQIPAFVRGLLTFVGTFVQIGPAHRAQARAIRITQRLHRLRYEDILTQRLPQIEIESFINAKGLVIRCEPD